MKAFHGGNPHVLINTSFHMRPGTQCAEAIHQSFAHKDFHEKLRKKRDQNAGNQ